MTDFYAYWDRQHEQQHERAQLNGHAAAPGTATAYAAAAIEDELSKLAATHEGRRNAQLNVSAYNLFQLVKAGHLDTEDTWNALLSTALGTGLTQTESQATLRSAWRAAHPRVVPEQQTVPQATVVSRPASADEPDEQSAPVLDQYQIDWCSLEQDDTKDEWIVEPILPARKLVALFSAPKVGKSLLLLEMAAAIATGRPVLGVTPEPRRVVYVDYENDPRADVRTRLVAMGYKLPELVDRLLFLSFPVLPGLDTKAGSDLLLDYCIRHDADAVVIDTVSRAVQGEENENDTWLRFYRHTGLALKQAGLACLRLDHTGKDPSKGMRGGSAKLSDVDAAWLMTAITETTFRLTCEAQRMPIAEKLLVLRRQLAPHLHHAVEGGGWAALADERQRQLIGYLNELYGDQTPPSFKDAMRRVKQRFGISPRFETVREAVQTRELSFNRLIFDGNRLDLEGEE